RKTRHSAAISAKHHRLHGGQAVRTRRHRPPRRQDGDGGGLRQSTEIYRGDRRLVRRRQLRHVRARVFAALHVDVADCARCGDGRRTGSERAGAGASRRAGSAGQGVVAGRRRKIQGADARTIREAESSLLCERAFVGRRCYRSGADAADTGAGAECDAQCSDRKNRIRHLPDVRSSMSVQRLSPQLEVICEGGVATVWMNRPDAHNAFDENLIGEITQAMTDLADDPAVSVIVLAGRGRSFSAGGDLGWMRRAASFTYEQNVADARGLANMLRAVANSPKTTIARVHGAALGGGMGLVSACDIAVASTAAVFATSEVKFGLIPATIGPYVMRAIGERQSLRYFQTAERIDAHKALQLGLVHEVVAPEQIDAKVDELIVALKIG